MQTARGASLSSSDEPSPGSPPGLRERLRPRLLLGGVAVLALVLDQVTKQFAVDRLTGRPPVPLVGDLLQLSLTRNPGAAFSTGTGFTPVFSVAALVATGVIVWLARRVATPLWALGMGLLLAGVLGNLVDRLTRDPGPMRGHVVDFLMLPHWPVFNVADVCINLAAVVIVVQALRGVRLDGRRQSQDDR